MPLKSSFRQIDKFHLLQVKQKSFISVSHFYHLHVPHFLGFNTKYENRLKKEKSVCVVSSLKNKEGSQRKVVARMLDFSVEEGEFELYLRYYVHFWTNALGYGLNRIIELFCNAGLGIK